MSGYTREELQSITYEDLFPQENRSKASERRRRLLCEEKLALTLRRGAT